MDLNERIDRIGELIRQRDDINAQLEELLGNPGPKPLTIRDRVPIDNKFPDKFTHRKQRTCKNCGQPGHRRDTCPNDPKVDPAGSNHNLLPRNSTTSSSSGKKMATRAASTSHAN